ncbi:mannose/fructose/sorbose PTS transporter subunit IIB [Marinilactibacillus sp. Marseille-P9653]|uniref:mannose/fructose/sorbose PTS transporter subunit IIB n=1 Tax=Marinilactibacillus sp. Marseille-P9653 TaxID=2866583 RepID=UPI001CE432CA|nr:mannose/fructose/sorbose PTS transporter subunit IIB [Marinilactibacillus sp. Marseille-P9653]
MVGIILASHGEFAEGILQSGSMIIGEQENVAAVTLMPSEGPDDIRRKMEKAIASFDTDEILFIVDLWGGTPFNQANTLFEGNKEKWAIVAGMNLPMVIEAYTSRFSMESAHEIASAIIGVAQDSVKVRPEELQPATTGASAAGNSEPNQALPEGTVVGDGKIKIGLARIDSRLLHGQVATAWSKDVNPTRIIVVSDNVAKDDLRRSLITQAAPPGVKANVVPVDKMIEVFKDPRFGKTKALLLFENPTDVVRVVEGGVELEEVNVGSMAHSEGKVMINNVLSVDQKDVDAFETLKKHGVKFDVRKVPADQRKNMWDLLKKSNMTRTV